jgi:ferredoxin
MAEVNIRYNDQDISVEKGMNLRKALMRNGSSPYNGLARHLNCRGLGSCGTCAVKISGRVEPFTLMENWRLSFPPHKKQSGLRLACQVKVFSDIVVTKGKGFWGER